MADMSDIVGKNLAQARKRAGLTQERLAELADVTQETVSQIENGRRLSRLAVIGRLAKAVHVPINALYLDPAMIDDDAICAALLEKLGYEPIVPPKKKSRGR